MADMQLSEKKVVRKNTKVKLKKFLTEFKLPDGKYCWEIKAKDWEEAEFICQRIGHTILGVKVTV